MRIPRRKSPENNSHATNTLITRQSCLREDLNGRERHVQRKVEFAVFSVKVSNGLGFKYINTMIMPKYHGLTSTPDALSISRITIARWYINMIVNKSRISCKTTKKTTKMEFRCAARQDFLKFLLVALVVYSWWVQQKVLTRCLLSCSAKGMS